MLGKVLGNRYRLVELIGEGGMALVYKAECSLLCRAVAVKILRPQYASDAEFVERFRREARSAASLSHPNVVNIYDVGQENGVDYIVMEYIPGNNLKNLIKQEAPFAVRRALDYTRQIAEALNHAHHRNIIHRDIKPHNILVTPDGQIKVTDFGIARAISESSFTQTGIVVGSVQYSSPEQVKAGVVGPQSDIYSLGCVLYEMLTGTLPFKGDTSISIALQHLQDQIIPVKQIRPDIPGSVEKLVNNAMAKEPSERYPSALAMLKDISYAQSRTSQETKWVDDVDLPTQIWKPVQSSQPGISKLKKWGIWIGGFLLSMLIMILVTVALLNVFNPPRSVVTVPNLVGKDLVEARAILKQNKLQTKVVKYLYNSNFAINTVISQKPLMGQKRKADSEVELVISKGPQLVHVPVLIGKTRMEAEFALEETGLNLGEILASYSPDYPEGAVIKQLPEANTQIEQGASVSITINQASESMVQIPNFIGRPLSEVRAELGALGLVFNQATPTPSNVYAEGIIIDQRPIPFDRVPLGTAMNFIVSSGPN